MFKINNFSIVPKYIIFLLDLGATVTALFIAILIQQNVALAATNWDHVLNAAFLMLLVNALVFTITKSYTGIVRYTGVQDAVRIAVAIGLSSFIILVINTEDDTKEFVYDTERKLLRAVKGYLGERVTAE